MKTRNIPLTDVLFTLVDLDADLVGAWRDAFSDCPRVHPHHGDLFARGADALVSPANSFGFMDGGLDLALSQRLGWHVEERVRARILDEHDGELPVGQALIVGTGREDFPFLVCAPTMRVPMDVSHTAHAHLAFRATLRAIRDHNADPDLPAIRSVRCAGLGTGNGLMPPRRCARQMRHAYEVVAHRRPLTQGGLAAAVREHIWLVDHEAR
jgi:O-acetyl-ADP-ribose deacetylase (regulator of RNase III)